MKSERRREYERYLRSAAWLARRAAAIAAAGGACSVCGGTQHLHVHHRTYKRFGAELPQDLQVLCRWCHRKKHRRKAKGKKPGRQENRPRVAHTRADRRAMRMEELMDAAFDAAVAREA